MEGPSHEPPSQEERVTESFKLPKEDVNFNSVTNFRKRPLSKDTGATTTSTTATKKKEEPRKNTAIFISGLPEDTSPDEIVDYFSKYGVIMDDMFTGGPRVKLYEDDNGRFKGEALVVYLREESAIMAASLLDESYFRPKVIIKVERAKFDPAITTNENPKDSNLKVEKRIWKQHMQQMSQKLTWTTNDIMSPEEEAALQAELRRREKYQRIVVLKGMFTTADTADVRLSLDLKEELLEECEKLGQVTAIHVLVDLLVCTVKFRDKEAAAACLRLMNGRYFDGRRITAILYDGSFSLKESKDSNVDIQQESRERIEKFGEWLESHDGGEASSSPPGTIMTRHEF